VLGKGGEKALKRVRRAKRMTSSREVRDSVVERVPSAWQQIRENERCELGETRVV